MYISPLSKLMNTCVLVGFVCSLATLGALFSTHHLAFDLISHFRIQYVILIFGVLCVALLVRRYLMAIILLGCLLIHVIDVARSQYQPASITTFDGPTIRVMSSNLLASNDQYEIHIKYIEAIDPDIIVFQEYSSAWAFALSTSLEDYKYKISNSLESSFGIALYSKLPIVKSGITNLADERRPSVDAVVSLKNSLFRVVGAHPPPPISEEHYIQRNRQLQALSRLSRSYAEPLVVLGDLNITPWSNHFKEFVQSGALHDGRRGLGIMPTWPSTILPLQIPIDHIVVNDGVQVLSMDTSDGLGSDHRSIWADIRIRR